MIKIIPRSPTRRRLLVVLTGVVAALFLPAAPAMPVAVIAFSMILICLCIWVAYIDLLRFRIPDLANLSIFLLGCFAIVWINPGLFFAHVIAAVSVCAVTWFLGAMAYRQFGTEVLGIGDAKLLGASTMWVGIWGLPSLVLVAALTGIAYTLLAGRRAKRVPFGPFVAVGLLAVWAYGPLGF